MQDAVEENLCDEDTQYCFKVNAKFTNKNQPTDSSKNFTFGCMPTISRETSLSCSDIEDTLKSNLLTEDRVVTFLHCKQCSTDFCNRPVLYQSINMLKKTHQSYEVLFDAIVRWVTLPVRLIMFDYTVLQDIIDLF